MEANDLEKPYVRDSTEREGGNTYIIREVSVQAHSTANTDGPIHQVSNKPSKPS